MLESADKEPSKELADVEIQIYCCVKQFKYFLLMQGQDLLLTVQAQQQEINELRYRLSRQETNRFQDKYKKALKEINSIQWANEQFKEELERLRSQFDSEGETQKQEFNEIYEKMLKDKNQLIGEKEALEQENEQLKYRIISIQESMAYLQNENNNLAQQKESLMIMSSQEGKDSKHKESEIKRNMDSYEENYASISKVNRKLQEQNRNLENEVYELKSSLNAQLEEKEVEIRSIKSAMREEYEDQLNQLRKEVSRFRTSNNELSIKVKSFAPEDKPLGDDNNEYDKQLIETLREVRMQMEPMRAHIAEIHEKREFGRERDERDKTSLQLKVSELEAEAERLREMKKIMEQKLLRQTEKNRRIEETEKALKKLEQENRMLGGRVIVLESKEVALRNRNGDELEERVLEFQNRVEMLLSDKETIPNTKNVGIHQLIALKAYILELDGKLKQVVGENEYAVKKYRSYKERCSSLIKQLKQHDIAINALKGKLQGYDKLVMKLQGELERAISVNDNEMRAWNLKVSEQTTTSIEMYKKKYESLAEKLSLQEKYSLQELETVKLNYETKIVQLNIKLEELNSVKETIGLYKSKNEELSIKLSERESELLDAKINKVPISQIPQPRNLNKQTIQRLNETINSKETMIINLEAQIRRMELEWKNKYTQMEQNLTASLNKKNNLEKERVAEMDRLEQKVRQYRITIAELEERQLHSPQGGRAPQEIDYKDYQSLVHKKSELEIDMEQLRTQYQTELAKNNKLNKSCSDAKLINQQLETELIKSKYEIKNVEQQLQTELSHKINEIQRLRTSIDRMETSTGSNPLAADGFKVSSLKMEMELMENQLVQLEKDKDRFYKRSVDLEREVASLSDENQTLRFDLQRAKNATNSQLQGVISELQLEINQHEQTIRILRGENQNNRDRVGLDDDELTHLKSSWQREKERLLQECEAKDDEVSRLVREIRKLQNELALRPEQDVNMNSGLQFKLSRLQGENDNLKDEIESLNTVIKRHEQDIRRLRDSQMQLNDELSNYQIQMPRLEQDLRRYREKEEQSSKQVNNLEMELAKCQRQIYSYRNNSEDEVLELQSKVVKYEQDLALYRNRDYEKEEAFADHENYSRKLGERINALEQAEASLENELHSKNSEIMKLNSQLNFTKSELQQIQDSISLKDGQLNRANSQLSQLKNEKFQWDMQLSNKESVINRLNSDVLRMKGQIEDLQIQLENAERGANRLKNQFFSNEEQSSEYKTNLQQKQMQIIRLQTDVKSKSETVAELNEEIEVKNRKVSELQSDIVKLRSASSDFDSELMEKDAVISRLKFEVSNLKSRNADLENNLDSRESDWSNLNREILAIKSNIYTYEEEIGVKESTIDRYKHDLKQLKEEIEMLNNQVFEKNRQINNLNQENFRIRMQGEDSSTGNISKLETQIYQLKSRVSNLESQLEQKQFELNKTESEIKVLRSNVKVNRYSDEEYDLLQAQFHQAQKSLVETRSRLSEKDLEITQLEAKVQFHQKIGNDLKSQGGEDRQYLQQELQAALERERKWKNELHEAKNAVWGASQKETESQKWGGSQKETESQKWGKHLYQDEVERLTRIVEELTEEISILRLRMTAMSDQENRINENLTVMALTFAEVEAMRSRMQSKENQITEVRNSMIQLAVGNQDARAFMNTFRADKEADSRIISRENSESLQNSNRSMEYSSSNYRETGENYEAVRHRYGQSPVGQFAGQPQEGQYGDPQPYLASQNYQIGSSQPVQSEQLGDGEAQATGYDTQAVYSHQQYDENVPKSTLAETSLNTATLNSGHQDPHGAFAHQSFQHVAQDSLQQSVQHSLQQSVQQPGQQGNLQSEQSGQYQDHQQAGTVEAPQQFLGLKSVQFVNSQFPVAQDQSQQTGQQAGQSIPNPGAQNSIQAYGYEPHFQQAHQQFMGHPLGPQRMVVQQPIMGPQPNAQINISYRSHGQSPDHTMQGSSLQGSIRMASQHSINPMIKMQSPGMPTSAVSPQINIHGRPMSFQQAAPGQPMRPQLQPRPPYAQ